MVDRKRQETEESKYEEEQTMKENSKLTLLIVTVLMALVSAVTILILIAVFLGINITQWSPAVILGSGFGMSGVIWGILMTYNH